MVPDYISEKMMLKYKVDKNGEGHCYTCMGCRSFLTPYVDENGKPKYYGRFNQGVVTINLVDVALSSGGNEENFWKIFDERLDLCYRALMCRHKPSEGDALGCGAHSLAVRRAGASAEGRNDRQVALWRIFHHFAGLCGALRVRQVHDGQEPHGRRGKALRACGHAAHERQVQGVEGEGETSISRCTARRSRARRTSLRSACRSGSASFRASRTRTISRTAITCMSASASTRSPSSNLRASSSSSRRAWAISYVEVPNMQNNIPAVLAVMQYIYDNIMYAELNTKSDYCQVCGYDGEIPDRGRRGRKTCVGMPALPQPRSDEDERLRAVPAAISERSSGTRAERRKSRTVSCTCNP